MNRLPRAFAVFIPVLVALALLVLHMRWLGPLLIRHGSSSAFDLAIGLGVALISAVVVLTCLLPRQLVVAWAEEE